MQRQRSHRANRRRCRDKGCLAPMSLSSDADDRQWHRCHCPVTPMCLASSASRQLTSVPKPFPSASGSSMPVRTSTKVPEGASSSASAAAGSSSSARRLAPPRQVDMDPVQRWIVTSIQTLWDAFVDLSRCGCVRPRSPTPPPASSPLPDDEDAEIDAYDD
ncbi:hypothetical protein AALP_AA5G182800 [Arabis alpina]|uniref:Uncharacterized protein n=1 Tax=Arabis alpina TaxID=50452 RepID=A0A087GXW4_ARAAL|nr:hypothetical protein AALP_AA5G182800 [Arabis alpina]